ncbi:Aste57867_9630 [Aphanomyces stellatus]|uniref:Aste57867_9630 protein n=1 Tax=Aphanomyces stellatus TaxID=120398 RepID=A0A485KNA7_9STRA|nr:hypothetical protein As57867_009592 [Aphanomyces stellatus]VFT86509.1 Aste57867_9630 [Aphanomyces stellatus]
MHAAFCFLLLTASAVVLAIDSMALAPCPHLASAGFVNASTATWAGSIAPFVATPANFCQCGFGGQGPLGCRGFICAGGNGGGTFQLLVFLMRDGLKAAATSVPRLRVPPAGGWPWRAFAYLEPCGPDQSNRCVDELTFSFKFDHVSTWSGYIKLLFFGDGHDVLGLWPNQRMKLVGFPRGDLPVTWQHETTLVENAWYDVRVRFHHAASSMDVELLTPGETTARVWHSSAIDATARAQLGVYTWAPDGPPFKLALRNLCMGKIGQCRFQCGTPVVG